jgi:hypothetical protein
MRRRSAPGRRQWARPSAVLKWAVLGASLVGQVAVGQARALALEAEGRGGQAAVGAASGPGHSVDDPLDDPLIVEIWTFGPGDHPFTRFGHDAIRIANRRTGLDVSYNFGTFAFGSASLLGDFLQGRLRYWLSAASTRAMASLYRRENRTIEIQRLALTPAQKRTLAEHLVVNAEPAHRDYRYDYFADNCSTRVRDALDAEGVLGGALRASAHGPGQETLRGHALRMTAEEPWLYLAMLVVLGPSTDRPIDAWAEAFLPERLQRMLRAVSVGGPQDRHGDGHGHPLVQAEMVSFRAAREPVPEHPPGWGGRFLAVGAGLGGMLWRLGSVGARSRTRARPGQRRSVAAAVDGAVVPLARIAYGVLCAILGLLVGFIGSFLVGAWMFTPHAVVYRNQNALLFAPFALALVVLGIGVAFGRTGAARKTFWLAVAGAALGAVALGLKLLPAGVVAHQENGPLIAAMLPLWAGLAAGARTLGWRRETDRPVTARGGSST